MNKIIKTLIILTSICILATGCGGNSKSSNQDVGSKKEETNSGITQKSERSKVETDFSTYSGSFVTEDNLRFDYSYGITVGITVDKDGNLKGHLDNVSNNVTHISAVDINGKLQGNKFTSNFNQDGWNHNGTITLELKDNKIVLTTKYTKNEDSSDMWGIGEGTFTLVKYETKVDRTLSDLEKGGFVIIKDQSFPVNLENYGDAKFIIGTQGTGAFTFLKYYLINSKSNVLYKFSDFDRYNEVEFSKVNAVSFTDVNNDGLKDIIIIAKYGESTVCNIYIQKGKEFVINKNYNDKINSSSNNKDINSVIKYIKENLLK